MTKTMLGKISGCLFGLLDRQIGLHLTFFCSDGSGVCDSFSMWDTSVKVTQSTMWTEKDRDKQYTSIVRRVSDVLMQAKKTDTSKLVGTPVELTIEDNTLRSWRVLTEVL
jgi:hypothetical protein